ncbi:MAG TPA: hypothetical protein V6C72_16090, partial [Chroococcales cyanobacterium]
DFAAQKGTNIALSPEAQKLLAEAPDTLLVQGGKYVGPEGLMGLDSAQSANLARMASAGEKSGGMLGRPVGMLKNLAPGRIGTTLSGLNPFGALDLTSASSQALGARSFYSGYASALGYLGTYNSLVALDRPIDPSTGKPMSYADAVLNANFKSPVDNVFVNSAWLGAFSFLRDGQIAKASLQTASDAGAVSKGWNGFKSVLSPGGFGASENIFRQGAYLGAAGQLYNFQNFGNLQYLLAAHQIGQEIKTIEAPISDQSAPQAQGLPGQNPAAGGDASRGGQAPQLQNTETTPTQGLTDQPAPQPGQQQQQQQGGSPLTQNTPGLG